MATTKSDEMWEHTNSAFAEANKAFGLFDDVINEQKGRVNTETTTTSDSHNLKFHAENWSQRRKLSRCFLKMAWQILWHGETKMRFRR